jgi:hypothetical protein
MLRRNILMVSGECGYAVELEYKRVRKENSRELYAGRLGKERVVLGPHVDVSTAKHHRSVGKTYNVWSSLVTSGRASE